MCSGAFRIRSSPSATIFYKDKHVSSVYNSDAASCGVCLLESDSSAFAAEALEGAVGRDPGSFVAEERSALAVRRPDVFCAGAARLVSDSSFPCVQHASDAVFSFDPEGSGTRDSVHCGCSAGETDPDGETCGNLCGGGDGNRPSAGDFRDIFGARRAGGPEGDADD